MVKHIAGDDGTHASLPRLPCHRGDPHRVIGAAALEQGHVGAGAVKNFQVGQRCGVVRIRFVGEQNRDHAVGPRRQVMPVQLALALSAASLAQCQQAREPRPRRSVSRIEDQPAPAGEIDPCAGKRAYTGDLLRFPGAHDTGDGAQIADTQRRIAKQRRGGVQLLRA